MDKASVAKILLRNYYQGVQRNRVISGKYPASGRQSVKGGMSFFRTKDITVCLHCGEDDPIKREKNRLFRRTGENHKRPLRSKK